MARLLHKRPERCGHLRGQSSKLDKQRFSAQVCLRPPGICLVRDIIMNAVKVRMNIITCI